MYNSTSTPSTSTPSTSTPSTSTPSTSTDICINMFVVIFVLSIRIKQVILFVWMNVFNCNNDVNVTACVAISTF